MAYYNSLSGIVPASVEAGYWQELPLDWGTPPPDQPVGSPLWWVWRLHAELLQRHPLVRLLDDYYEGRHKLGLSTREYQRVFGEALAPVSDPWMSLVVRSSVERLEVQGFRLGESNSDPATADDDAWRIWQANDLDEDSPLAFTEAVKLGESYLLVWKSDRDELPRITAEHPGQMVVARDPRNRRRVVAAWKVWQNLAGGWDASLFLPDHVLRMTFDQKRDRWAPRETRSTPAQERNPLGFVPVIPLVNDPSLLPCYPPTSMTQAPHLIPASAAIGLGRSDLADVVSTQDQINKILCDLLVASEFGAHRQRYMTGVEPGTDADGNPVPIDMGAARLVTVEAADARIGDLNATDLSNYTRPLEQRIQSLASRTRVPVHYLLGGQGSFPSGESLRAAETGLVAKVKDKQRSFGGSLERAMRVAFAWLGDPRATAVRAEVDWRDPEYRTESEFVDSQTKKLALGIPPQQLWEDLGYTPTQIDRMRAMIRQAAIEGALIDPLAVNPNGAQPDPAAEAAVASGVSPAAIPGR